MSTGTEIPAHDIAGKPEPDVPRPRARRRHRFWVTVLVVLALLAVPVTAIAGYAKVQLGDTDTYVDTVSPLARDAAIQGYIADTVTTRLFRRVDVAAYVEDALPPRASGLAGPVTGAVRTFVRAATLRVVQSEAFQATWDAANRRAHTQVVRVLTGEGGAIAVSSRGTVSLDLSRIVSSVKDQLASSGITAFESLPADRVGGSITLFTSDALYQARHAVTILDAVALVLPFVVLALLAGVVLLSRNRRRGFVVAAATFAAGAALLSVALAVGRSVYLDAAAQLTPDAAAAAYDTLVRSLTQAVRTALVLSLVVVVAAVFAGPSRLAVGFRRSVRGAVAWLGGESDRAGWTVLGRRRFVVLHKTGIRIVTVAIAAAGYLVWEHPTPGATLGLAALALLALLVVEFFGREVPSVREVRVAGS